VLIEKWESPKEGQMSKLGKNHWSVERLIDLSKDFEIMKIPLNHLNVYHNYERITLREMATYIRAVNDADLSYPIIMDEDGEIMDGRHRIVKCLVEGIDTIRAVRFDKNPEPCRRDNE
tara:strand:- start:1888 stop:2241 length:354 start_codon:yes stop_codon:yes gene_type:complete